ncbi:hypothetical protein Scep_024455 [Stephania cephalantha]|uniref:Uncharacterized protein n=1 Tax=Stephania cephalantha TaxID=152367 RepID=A0AAP0HYG9_9MAGN
MHPDLHHPDLSSPRSHHHHRARVVCLHHHQLRPHQLESSPTEPSRSPAASPAASHSTVPGPTLFTRHCHRTRRNRGEHIRACHIAATVRTPPRHCPHIHHCHRCHKIAAAAAAAALTAADRRARARDPIRLPLLLALPAVRCPETLIGDAPVPDPRRCSPSSQVAAGPT